MRRLLKVLLGLAIVAIAIAIVGVAGAFFLLRRSLPNYDADALVTSLSAPVTVERDALAIPTIHAATWTDAARALGYVHAQDRLFQMDLARRYPAGRLAELIGAPLVEIDKRQRRYQFERVARDVYDRLPARQRALLQAYADGVNAAIGAMPARPPEYLILRTSPEPWRPVDCVLVNFNMHLGLSLFGDNEQTMGALRERLPRELVDFLMPRATSHDAPLVEGDPPVVEPPIPGPDVIDLRKGFGGMGGSRAPGGGDGSPAPGNDADASVDATPHASVSSHPTDRTVPGSNAFAIAGSRTADGRAILENDMHLGFSAPNIWYRAEIKWDRADKDESPNATEDAASKGASGGGGGGEVVGVTLPGVPSVIVGSNTHVAWGFTNATGDFVDHIVVETLPDDPNRYRTPDADEPFSTITETINVRGGKPVILTMRATRWGPVFDTDAKGRPIVLQWTATDPDRNNLAILDMPMARTLDDAVAIARAWHGPPQNTILAAADGRIAWVLAGDLPRRRGLDGAVPMPRTDPNVGWFGSLPEDQRPVLIDPPGGILFTANNRTLPLDRADVLGHNWAPPFRAARIRDLLQAKPLHDERSLLDIALDTRLEAYDFYRDLVLQTIPAGEPDPVFAAARRAAANWNGHADLDSTGLLFLIRFRNALNEGVLGGLFLMSGLPPGADTGCLNDDEPLRRLLEQRPPNFLMTALQPTWDSMIRRAIENAARTVTKAHPRTLLETPWSAVNLARIKNPLTLGLRALVPILDMPADPLPGHPWCPRVAAPTFGASERLVVAPGHEADGICHMPTGQCGHPLSRHYRDMQRAYVTGAPTPLLPGPTEHTLTLRPSSPIRP